MVVMLNRLNDHLLIIIYCVAINDSFRHALGTITILPVVIVSRVIMDSSWI